MIKFIVAHAILLWGIIHIMFIHPNESTQDDLKSYFYLPITPSSNSSSSISNQSEAYDPNPRPSLPTHNDSSIPSGSTNDSSNPEQSQSNQTFNLTQPEQKHVDQPSNTPETPNEPETSPQPTESEGNNPETSSEEHSDAPEENSQSPEGSDTTEENPPSDTSSEYPSVDPSKEILVPLSHTRQNGHEEGHENSMIKEREPPVQYLTNITDSDIKVIFKSNKTQNDTQCHQKALRAIALCKLGLSNSCKRRGISEELPFFWIISPIYSANHQKAARLYELHRNFRNYVQSYGINFQTVEVIFPGQEFQLTKANNQPYDIQYRDNWIFAMRENLVNVGIKHLPDNWQYVSWIDQHIYWIDGYWFEKAIWQMSHYNIVQLLNGSDFWNLNNKTDYRLEGIAMRYYIYGSECWRFFPVQFGLAWGMRREIFNQLGGLLDVCIGTKCDLYQLFAYIGLRYTLQTDNPEYAEMIGQWQDHAREVFKQSIGFINSTVIHFMHCYDGCKTSDYDEQIWRLNKNHYSPTHDLVRDDEGRLSLVNNLPLAQDLWIIYGGDFREA